MRIAILLIIALVVIPVTSAERIVVYGNIDNAIKCSKELGFCVVNLSQVKLRISGIKYELDKKIWINFEPNDPYYHDQWYLGSVNVDDAWTILLNRGYNFNTSDVVVAVIDTGVDYNHPDIKSHIWINRDEIPNNGIDDDNNGYIDDYYGYDFVNEDGDPMDDNGHGTAVAGIISAVTNNGIGIAGISNAKIMILKVLDKNGEGYQSNLAFAIEYAVKNGANVISMSFGSKEYIEAVKVACDYAWQNGLLLIASSGNDGIDKINYPASFESVIAVGSIDRYDELSHFSNYGINQELVAPGENIVSIAPNNEYVAFSGTSASSPIVSGISALIWSAYPNITNLELRKILRKSADDLGLQGYDVYYGYGKVNASRALLLLNRIPIANFTYYPLRPLVNKTITFISRSYDVDGYVSKVYWDFGDGNKSEGFIVNHTYKKAGYYTVTCTVYDDIGVVNKTSKIIKIFENNTPPIVHNIYTFEEFVDGVYSINENLTFFVNASDVDGRIMKYVWCVNGTCFNTLWNNFNVKFQTTGLKDVAIEVCDDSDECNISVLKLNVYPYMDYFDDYDGDGWANLAEVIAGTNYTDSSSKPNVTDVFREIYVNENGLANILLRLNRSVDKIVEYLPKESVTFVNCSCKNTYLNGRLEIVPCNLTINYAIEINQPAYIVGEYIVGNVTNVICGCQSVMLPTYYIVLKYNCDYRPQEPLTPEMVLVAIINAIDEYFNCSDDKCREFILNDIIKLIEIYFNLLDLA